MKQLKQKETQTQQVQIISRVFQIMSIKTDKGRNIDYGKINFEDENHDTVFVSLNLSSLNDELAYEGVNPIRSGDEIRVVGTLSCKKYTSPKNGKEYITHNLKYITEVEVLNRAEKTKVKVVKKDA